MKKLKPTIGLEIHLELSTDSKMFCGCSTNHFRTKPNSNTCPVCLGLPGALPVPNKKAIEGTITLALALNAKINRHSSFDRKHYFYPDLPKGFQISQYHFPIAEGGQLMTSQGKTRIKRIHLEEDTAKLKHRRLDGLDVSLIDFNRSGIPLVEIVTEPDIVNSDQAREFSQELQRIGRTLKLSNCDMEKGSMRLEANVSWGLNLGYKVELKNINSFRFLAKAIDYELKRQKTSLDKGIRVKQETRGWDEKRQITVHQRYKEGEDDYRYFPEPDIPPMEFSSKLINSLKKNLPKLPDEIAGKLIVDFNLRESYAQIISLNENLLKIFLKLAPFAKKEGIKFDSIASELVNKKLSSRMPAENIIERVKLRTRGRISDVKTITKLVEKAVDSLPKASKDIEDGKIEATGVIVGKVMGLSQGKADPELVRNVIAKKFKI